jgi:putative ABC transport system permease protein
MAKKLFLGSSVSFVRKGLVVFQFVVAVFMIFSTLIIYKQLKLFHQKDLGFDKEQLLAVTMYGSMREQYGSLLNEMKANPSIRDFATVSTLPGERFSTQPFKSLSVKRDGEESSARVMWTDDKWLSALGVTLKEGSSFTTQYPKIEKNEFILNEAAVKTFGLNDPIGKKIVFGADTGEVVGVVKDFNFASLHAKVDPLVVQYNPYNSNYLLLKVQGDHVQQVLQFMESKLKVLAPASVFTYSFVDDQLNRLYAAENRMSQIFKAFALFAIFISCLGLFGLSAYAAELRKKEVGIRKVLGATVANVTMLLSKDFIKLVLIGIMVAWPLAWWAMAAWLDGFAYRTEIHLWTFALSGILAIVVAFVTVSFQAIRTALSNPVNSLRTE